MPATLVDAADFYVALRPFTALGRTVVRGEVFDCAGWRNVQPLVNTRRLAPIWSLEGRAALPEDFDINILAGAEDGEVSSAETPRRRPGRPRKEEVAA